MNWRIKGVVQNVLSAVPGGVRANDVLQRTFGELRHVERTVDSKVVDDWLELAGELDELHIPIGGSELVEIGTGWMPVFPLCFALCGAQSCHTFDLSRHLDHALTRRALERLGVHLARIAEAGRVPVTDVEARYRELSQQTTVEGMFRCAGIRYHAPADASRTSLADASVDVVFSNSVLEHVLPDALRELFQEASRLLKPGGAAVHSLNCADHYAYFDRSITFINYLKYTDRQWRRWNNDLLFQNRLRPIDFTNVARAANLDVVLERSRPRRDLLDLLPTFPLAPKFRHYSPEDLCTTSLDFACRVRRPGGAASAPGGR